jgi:hypothetical protein
MGSRPCRALQRLCTRRRFKFSHVSWLVGLQAEGHLARCGHVADAAVGHDQHRHQHGKHNGARCDLGRAMGRAGARLGSAARAPAHPAVPSRIDAIEFGQATRLLDAGCGSGVAAALAELRRGRQPRRLGADQYLGPTPRLRDACGVRGLRPLLPPHPRAPAARSGCPSRAGWRRWFNRPGSPDPRGRGGLPVRLSRRPGGLAHAADLRRTRLAETASSCSSH